MAIDQRDVSSTLRFMDDRALQQYAAMHKNDPYIFPLAFQESQNRQRLRMSQQGAQGMQPQPKVNEQALAQMAPPQAQPMPEDVGIGALPAGNMQFAAEGGIMGYDDANFAARSEPVVMMAGGGVARYQVGGNTMGMPSLEQQDLTAQAAEITDAMVAEQKNKAATIAQLEQKLAFLTNAGAPQAAEVRAQLDALKASGAPPKPTPKPADASFRRQEDPRMKPGVAATAQPLITSGAAPRPNTTRQPRPNTGQETPRAPAVPEQTAAQRYAEMQKGMEPERAGIDKGIASLSESMRKTTKGELEDFEKDVAERGVAFKGREERLAKREAELGKRKGDLGSFAMLEFGLGLLAEPGNFAAAVGRVGQRTATNYSAGLKDLRAAQEKMDDARDQIEEFRRNENNMTAKERRQFKTAINRTETDIEKLGLQAAEKMYGYKRSDAETIFKADTQERLTDKEIDVKRDIAAMQERGQSARSAAQIAATLNTPDRLVFNQLLKDSGNDAVKAAEALQKMKAEKFNVYDSYSKYLAGFAGKDPAMVGAPESITKYASRFAALTPPAPVDTNKPTRP
jgi:hypothetical protein